MLQNYTGLGTGRHRVMDLPRSMYAVYFSTTDAMLREANKLHIKLNAEDAHAIDNTNDVNFYSIRSYNGAPCVLLKTQNDAVQWCRGENAKRPANYMRQIVTFIVKKQLLVAADMACTGIVSQNGKYYNVYDLPHGFIYNGNMDLSNVGFRYLPDMRTVIIKGDYNISGNALCSYEGIPQEVFGDFYGYDSGLKGKPIFCKIHGKFYGDNRKSH